MVFDYRELRADIKRLYGTEMNFAKAIGMNKGTLSLKLSNKSEFTQRDMLKIAEALHSHVAMISAYFFTPIVTKTQQEGREKDGA